MSSSETTTLSASATRSRIIDAFTSLIAWSALRLAQPNKVQLAHLLGRHALLCQSPQAAIQTSLDLLLHKRLRNRELKARNHLFQHLVLGLVLEPVLLALPRHLAKLGLKFLKALISSQLLGKLRVALRKDLSLDRL